MARRMGQVDPQRKFPVGARYGRNAHMSGPSRRNRQTGTGIWANPPTSRRGAMSETRKLAAILVADVVGYSRLAGADEDRTLARLRGLRSDLIDPAIAAHHGRIVKRTGDGCDHRVSQRRGRGPLRDRDPERPHRAQRWRAGGPADRIPRRHSRRRRRRGERRRSHGGRRQYRRALGGDRRAWRDLSFRGRLSAGQRPARDGGHRSRADPTQEHRQVRFAPIRCRSGSLRGRNRRKRRGP